MSYAEMDFALRQVPVNAQYLPFESIGSHTQCWRFCFQAFKRGNRFERLSDPLLPALKSVRHESFASIRLLNRSSMSITPLGTVAPS